LIYDQELWAAFFLCPRLQVFFWQGSPSAFLDPCLWSASAHRNMFACPPPRRCRLVGFCGQYAFMFLIYLEVFFSLAPSDFTVIIRGSQSPSTSPKMVPSFFSPCCGIVSSGGRSGMWPSSLYFFFLNSVFSGFPHLYSWSCLLTTFSPNPLLVLRSSPPF